MSSSPHAKETDDLVRRAQRLIDENKRSEESGEVYVALNRVDRSLLDASVVVALNLLARRVTTLEDEIRELKRGGKAR